MVSDYPGQSIGGSKAPNGNSIKMSNEWIEDMNNVVIHKQLSASVSKRWLKDLSIMENNFYGDIVQQYSASFPRAFRPSAKEKPEHTSIWKLNINVVTSQLNWNRIYGIDIDESEATKISNGEESVSDFTINNIQEGINSANIEELSLVTYLLSKEIKEVTNLNQYNAWQELSGEIESHLAYVVNESYVTADDTVVVMTDFKTAAKLKALPALRYVDKSSRDAVLDKIVKVPFIPEVYVTTKEILVTQDMIDNNCLIENYSVGQTIPVNSLVIDPVYFPSDSITKVLEDSSGNTPNILVFDKRSIFVGNRPTLMNWSDIEGDIQLYTQTFNRGLVYQHTLNRSMNVSFCNLFKMRAFRYDYKQAKGESW